MRPHVLEGQIKFDLFPEEKRVYTKESMRDECINWLCKYHGCDRGAITPIVIQLYDEFPTHEAFDRAKVLRNVCGKFAVEGWTVQDAIDYIGIFEHGDYHVVWDRSYAATKGYAKEQCARVVEWDYRAHEPIFERR